MALNDDIADALIAHHVRVLRLASGEFDRVAKILRELDKQTVALLMRMSDGDGVIKRPDVVIQAIYRLNQKAYKEIQKELSKELTDLASHEVEYASGLMRSLVPNAKFIVPSKAYVNAIVSEEPMFGGLLSEWVDGLAQGRYQRIRNLVRLSAAARSDVSDLIKKVRGQKKLGYRDGVAALSFRSAKTLVNTAYNHVANKARYDFFAAQPTKSPTKLELKFGVKKKKKKKKKSNVEVEGFIWAATLDDLTCITCDSLDGEYFEAEEYYEIQSSTHPNCRCVGIPLVDVEEVDGGREVDDDDWKFGVKRPKVRLRYSDWLNRQTASFQDEILGAERAQMFRRGMPLKKFVDASGIRYNLSELRKIEAEMISKGPKMNMDEVRSNTDVLRNWGYFPDLGDRRDRKFGLVNKESIQIPTRISLRNKMPPIWDQGELGACVAFASIAAYIFAHQGTQMMSALDLYWKARFLENAVDEDSGCMIRDAVKALQKWGVCTEKTWPYLIRKFRIDPPKVADQEALKYRITSYERVQSLQDCMNCLARGYPFILGFSVYGSFLSEQTEKTGIALMPQDEDPMLGGHCVLATGMDQDFHNNPVFKRSGLSKDQVPKFMFECRNTWTAKWGDGGYFYIPAEYVNDTDLTSDMWMIKA